MIFKKIFDSIISLYRLAWDFATWVGGFLRVLWDTYWAWGMFLVGAVMFLLSYLLTTIVWLAPRLDQILAILSGGTAIQGGIQIPAPLAQGMAFMNSFIPLAEAAQVLVLGITLIGLTTVFRIIKSWVPTVN